VTIPPTLCRGRPVTVPETGPGPAAFPERRSETLEEKPAGAKKEFSLRAIFTVVSGMVDFCVPGEVARLIEHIAGPTFAINDREMRNLCRCWLLRKHRELREIDWAAFLNQFRSFGGSATDELLAEQAKKLNKQTIEVESIVFDLGW
jgi:hypothetical protein